MGKQAFKAERKSIFMMDPNELVIIGVDTKDGPEHPLFQRRALDPIEPEFVENVKMEGIIETVSIVKVGEQAIVKNGRRRVRAARLANKELKKIGSPLVYVPTMIFRVDDKTAVRKGISANAHQVPDSPMDQARHIGKLLELGGTKQEAMVAIGAKHLQTVESRLRLLELPSDIQTKLDKGEISTTQALDGLKSGAITSSMAPNQKVAPKPKLEKRKMGRPTGPSKPVVKKLLDVGRTKLPLSFVAALSWVLGEISAEEAGIDHLLPKKRAK
jgi:hypothetical protein